MRHVGFVPLDPPLHEGAVVGAASLEFRRHRQGEHDIGTRSDLDEEVGLFGDARALRVYDDQPGAARPACRLDFPREMQVGHGDVVAPDDDEVRMAHLLGRHPGRRSVETCVRGTSHNPAQLPAREQRGSKPVEEAAVHGASRKLAVRPGVVQRQHRLRAVPRDGATDACMNQVQGLVPGDWSERALAAPARALERTGEPSGSVHELGIGACDLVADHAGRVRIGLRTTHVQDAGPIRPD